MFAIIRAEPTISPWEIDCEAYLFTLQVLERELDLSSNVRDPLLPAARDFYEERIVSTVQNLCEEHDEMILVLQPEVFQELSDAINALDL